MIGIERLGFYCGYVAGIGYFILKQGKRGYLRPLPRTASGDHEKRVETVLSSNLPLPSSHRSCQNCTLNQASIHCEGK